MVDIKSTVDRHKRVAKDIERVQSVLTSANCKLRQVKNDLDALALRAIQDLRKFQGLDHINHVTEISRPVLSFTEYVIQIDIEDSLEDIQREIFVYCIGDVAHLIQDILVLNSRWILHINRPPKCNVMQDTVLSKDTLETKRDHLYDLIKWGIDIANTMETEMETFSDVLGTIDTDHTNFGSQELKRFDEASREERIECIKRHWNAAFNASDIRIRNVGTFRARMILVKTLVQWQWSKNLLKSVQSIRGCIEQLKNC